MKQCNANMTRWRKMLRCAGWLEPWTTCVNTPALLRLLVVFKKVVCGWWIDVPLFLWLLTYCQLLFGPKQFNSLDFEIINIRPTCCMVSRSNTFFKSKDCKDDNSCKNSLTLMHHEQITSLASMNLTLSADSILFSSQLVGREKQPICACGSASTKDKLCQQLIDTIWSLEFLMSSIFVKGSLYVWVSRSLAVQLVAF